MENCPRRIAPNQFVPSKITPGELPPIELAPRKQHHEILPPSKLLSGKLPQKGK